MALCEDYPCCGHTDGLGCDWRSPNDDPNLYFCECNRFHRKGKDCPYDGDPYYADLDDYHVFG